MKNTKQNRDYNVLQRYWGTQCVQTTNLCQQNVFPLPREKKQTNNKRVCVRFIGNDEFRWLKYIMNSG